MKRPLSPLSYFAEVGKYRDLPQEVKPTYTPFMIFHKIQIHLKSTFASVLGLLLMLFVSCESAPVITVEPGIEYKEGCENINVGHCLLPWPSDRFIENGQLHLPTSHMPMSLASGVRVDASQWERFDGFSPATSLMTLFEGDIQDDELVNENEISQSILASSPTQLYLLEGDTLVPVPHFAEVDGKDAQQNEKRPLFIRPSKRLLPGRRYIAAISNLHTKDGASIKPSLYFQALKEHWDESALRLAHLPVSEILARQSHFDAMFEMLERAGVLRGPLLEAWDFTTATDSNIQSDLLVVKQDSDLQLPRAMTQCNVLTETPVTQNKNGKDVERGTMIDGTIRVPLYTQGPGPSSSESRLARNSDGKPVLSQWADIPFKAFIPVSAITSQRPVRAVLYGHGLLGLKDEVGYADALNGWERLNAIAFAADWWGMSTHDLGRVAVTLGSFSDMDATGERLIQSIINFDVLAKSIRHACAAQPAFTHPSTSKPLYDPTHLYYYGISQGGIMGMTLASVSEGVIDGYVIGVAGAAYGSMILRSQHWERYRTLVKSGFEDPIEQVLLMTMIQSLWDLAEPAGFISRLKEPLLNNSKRILFQIGLGDSQVHLVSSLFAARSMGLSLLTPASIMDAELAPVASPAHSALVTYGFPDISQTTGMHDIRETEAHGLVRQQESALSQIDDFMQPNGMVIHHCNGPCDPN